jgi:carbamoyl-phosphate synthase large subunit
VTLTVAISSAGRQAALVAAFQATPYDVRVLAIDADPYAAALAVADEARIAPPFDSDEYPDWLARLCREHRVGMLLTLNEIELHRLERIRPRLAEAGTRLLGMPVAALDLCIDKRRHAELSAEAGLRVPETWRPQDLAVVPPAAFPVVLKQATGRGSRGLVVAQGPDEAAAFFRTGLGRGRSDDYLVQPLLAGVEYGLDVVNDLDGRPRAVLQRQKHRMRAGETDVATTVADPRLEEIGLALGRTLGHTGVADVDVLRADGGDYLLDVNPRFGGGYAFSHAAGANIPATLVAWHLGKDLDLAWLAPRPGRRFARVSALQAIDSALAPDPA